MIICHKDRWVAGNKTSYLPLPNLLTYKLQMITKLYRIPQKTLFGVYNKMERIWKRGLRVWTPFEAVEVWRDPGPIRASNLLQNVHNLSQTSELLFAGNHIKTLKIVVKILIPNLQIYIKNMSVKYCRNERFKGLETIMQTEWQTNIYNSFERFAFWSQLLDVRRGIPRLSSKCR